MKKILSVALIVSILLLSTSNVFAANHVSQMATTKGGQHVAQCAVKMDQGVSDCVNMIECDQTIMMK